MEKSELTLFLIGKFNERNNEVIHNDGDLDFKVNGVTLPKNNETVSADFSVGGDDRTHIVRFVIKCPVSVRGDYNKFLNAVNEINASITTGKYFLEGEGESAFFCSSYDAPFFNTRFEKMNVEKIMMFMFDSLLLEYADILMKI